MAFALTFTHIPRAALVQLAGVVGVVAGVAFWAPRLLAPAAAPPTASAAMAELAPAPAAQWFANRPAEVQVSVSGLLDTGRGAVSIVSVNGAPPQAVRVGETLARGVRLVAIDSQGLTLARGEQRSHVAIARLPDTAQLAPLTRP